MARTKEPKQQGERGGRNGGRGRGRAAGSRRIVGSEAPPPPPPPAALRSAAPAGQAARDPPPTRSPAAAAPSGAPRAASAAAGSRRLGQPPSQGGRAAHGRPLPGAAAPHAVRNPPKKRAKNGYAALRQIRLLQKTVDLLIAKLPFWRLVKEIHQDMFHNTQVADFRWATTALAALQVGTARNCTHRTLCAPRRAMCSDMQPCPPLAALVGAATASSMLGLDDAGPVS